MKRLIFCIVTFAVASSFAASELPKKLGESTTIEAEAFELASDPLKPEDNPAYIEVLETGKWSSYSLDNPSEGMFDIELMTSSAFEAASITLEIGEIKIVVPVPYSGSWDSWRRSTVFNIKIPKGELQMKLSTETGNFFIDHFKFMRRPPG